jgi:hypothetical protein
VTISTQWAFIFSASSIQISMETYYALASSKFYIKYSFHQENNLSVSVVTKKLFRVAIILMAPI